MEGNLNFSFDIQRFDNTWSIGGSNSDKYIFGAGGTSVASLFVNSSASVWSLAGGAASTVITLDLTNTSDNTIKSIAASLDNSTSPAILDASSVTNSPFHFKLNSDTKLNSIAGGSSGNSLDASAVSASDTLWLIGGNGADSIFAGSVGTFYLNGGVGSDSLVGGDGTDYFIYDSSSVGLDSISGYGTGDIVSLTSGNAVTGGASLIAIAGGSNFSLNFGNSKGLVFENPTAPVTLKTSTPNSTYLYTKDAILDSSSKGATLGANTDTFAATTSPYASVVTIDGSAVTTTGGLTIWANDNATSIKGASTVGSSIHGGTANMYISLNASNTVKDVFYYAGGNDTVLGLSGNGDLVSLTGSNLSLVTVGTALESIEGTGSDNNFKLTFDSNNTLTFLGAKAAVSINNGNDILAYTPTAISVGGGHEVTLGKSYDSSSFAGTAFSLISAAAVPASVTGNYFAVSGSTNGGNIIWGSDSKITSILGGTGADTLYAGTPGASLVGNGGSDLLVGDSAKATVDYFFYAGKGNTTIRNYIYNSEGGGDIVSLTGHSLSTAVDHFKYDGNNFNISLAGGDSNTAGILTFEGAPIVEIRAGGTDSLFHYEADRVIVNDNRITLASDYLSKNFNVSRLSDRYANVATIDASAITGALNITGNAENANSIIGAQGGGNIIGGAGADYLKSGVTVSGATVTTTLDGGEGNDSLVGNNGYDLFIYRGGKDSIGGYSSDQDTVQVIGFNMIRDGATFTSLNNTNNANLVIGFGDSDNNISIAGGASLTSGVTIKNGTHNFVYKTGAVTLDEKTVTLTSDYKIGSGAYSAGASITAVDASAVSLGSGTLSLNGSAATKGIRLIGSDSLSNSLLGGAGNDYLSGGNKGDIFIYTGGKDTVANYQYSVTSAGALTTDSLVAEPFFKDGAIDIESGKATNTKLIFKKDNKNTLTFQFDDTPAPRISLGGDSGYLTKDGHVKGNSLKLFASAKGEIALNASPYIINSSDKITTVDASEVKNQGVTLVAASVGASDTTATYILPGNKQRDRFVYAGGAVSISNYDSGKDQLNLGIGDLSGFSIAGNNDVLISVGGSSSDVISIKDGKSQDFLIHEASYTRDNLYRKMSFNQSGILTNKASKPTIATVLGGAASLQAASKDMGEGSLKKIYLDAGVGSISIEAGDKYNTIIDGSAVTGSGAVSLYGGKKNDKLIGSNVTDASNMFVYKMVNKVGGKDVISNFSSESDSISVVGSDKDVQALLSDTKITTGAKGKNVTFKFNNKNSLLIKAGTTDESISSVNIGDTTYTIAKNAFSTVKGAVSLTSNFGGTFNTSKTFGDAVSSVDGHLVTKNLTFKGTDEAESLMGGQKKTTFYGAGGQDTLVGGSGKDVFVYGKNEMGNVTIADFDFKNDKLKIASGTINKIETVASAGIKFSTETGSFQITSSATYTKSGGNITKKQGENTLQQSNTVIKAGNTYYWFAPTGGVSEQVTIGGQEKTITVAAGELITYDTRVSSGKIGSNVGVIDLGYSTNLVKAGVATAFSSTNEKATLPNDSNNS